VQLTALSFAWPDVSANERAQMLEPVLPVRMGRTEVFFLSTCLRVEVAWSGGPDLAPAVLEELYGTLPLPPGKVRTDLGAFQHLCRVAAGLESAQVGEAEVLAQFRQAVELLVAARLDDTDLGRVMEAAVGVARAGRRSLSAGHNGSLANAAARIVNSLPEVVVLGGGAMSRAVVRELDQPNVTIYARRPKPIAGHDTRPWEEAASVLMSCRAVVSTIPGPVPLLDDLKRSGDPLVVVDLGMPPAITDPGAADRVIYRGVDHVASSMRSDRDPAAEEAVAIESEKAWGRLTVSHEAGSIIRSVVDRVEQTVDEEARRFAGRLLAADDSEQVLRQLAHTVARRIIHPSVSLLGSTELAPEELDVVARAFGVDRA
jgi:glutamyl-tRNA reductase